MALDGIFLRHLCKEIIDNALPSKVDKVYQPTKEEIILSLRTKDGNKKLLMSSRSDGSRVNFTNHKIENPEVPPMLCMLFRKKLIGAKLVDVKQHELDRIVRFYFDTFNNVGDAEKISIIVELFGKHSNIILLDENDIIIDATRRIGVESSSMRVIMPGVKYALPPSQNKMSLLSDNIDDIIKAVNEKAKTTRTKSDAILAVVQGISPIACRELEFIAKGDNEFFDDVLKSLEVTVKNVSGVPCMVSDAKKPLDVSFVKITQYKGYAVSEIKESFSELIDEFYLSRNSLNRMNAYSKELHQKLHSIRLRMIKKMNFQEIEVEESKNRGEFKIYGDILSANINEIKKGMTSVRLENFYDNKLVDIKLDPLISPVQNIQKYYKKYKKAATAEKILKEEIEKGTKELEYIDSVLDALTRIKNREDLLEISQELYEQKYLRRLKSKPKKKKSFSPIMFPSDDCHAIFVGRNNKENDNLTFKYAKKEDIWFHAKNVPGSHTLLIMDSKQPSKREIYNAACLAALNSKAKNSSKVAVDYTYVKNVKKPKGAKPGMVIYVSYKTIYVDPSDAPV